MKIEFLYFDGCPSYAEAEKLLNEVLKEARLRSTIEKKNIVTEEMAVAERFLGSPSIRIDGVDVDPLAENNTDYGIKCRVYYAGGSLVRWPSKEMIEKALALRKT